MKIKGVGGDKVTSNNLCRICRFKSMQDMFVDRGNAEMPRPQALTSSTGIDFSFSCLLGSIVSPAGQEIIDHMAAIPAHPGQIQIHKTTLQSVLTKPITSDMVHLPLYPGLLTNTIVL